MKTRLSLVLIPAALLVLGVAAPGPARNVSREADLANRHLSAIVLIQRFAQAVYRFLPPVDNGCPPTDTGFIDNGDGTFTRRLTTADCSRVVITNFGGSPSDYDIDTTLSSGIRELLQVRTAESFNGGPGKVSFVHTFSTGDRVEYLQELQQEAALDEGGAPIFGLSFWYALVSNGSVRLRSGQSMNFELRQTKSYDCFNFFNGTDLPPDVCDEWFVFNEEFGVMVPRPDRLHVELQGGARGTLDLSIPVLDPFAGIPDFALDTTGTIDLGGGPIGVRLFTDTPEAPGWKFWETGGPGYAGSFLLGEGFSGGGQAFRTGAGSRRRLHFAARWNRSGIGTVILPNGQTRPAGPTSGALEFGNLKWSGLASAFGPAPGL